MTDTPHTQIEWDRWEGSPAGLAATATRELEADPTAQARIRCYNQAEAEDVRQRIPPDLRPRVILTWLEWPDRPHSLLSRL